MPNNFLNSLQNTCNQKFTENGGAALRSTLDPVLDLFGTIGAMRSRTEEEIFDKFMKAYIAEPLLAMKILFYTRDIRGGLGERDIPRIIFKKLAKYQPAVMEKNLGIIPIYGRWDDLYVFVGTSLQEQALKVMHDQFLTDLQDLASGKAVSLLGKWLKSENTSSYESRRLAKVTREFFGLTPRQYRVALSDLRKKIEVVEREMSANSWSTINYENVPSQAMRRYREVFGAHDGERFSMFEEAVKSGEATIKAGAMYPYEIVRDYVSHGKAEDSVLELQWKALPNYVQDKNYLVMADVSGSMTGTPMEMSISLAIYFAERNPGPFGGQFMTFSERPDFVTFDPNWSLQKKVAFAKKADWGMNTDLELAFQKVLAAAVVANAKPEEIPEAIIVITDMEIDEWDNSDLSKSFTDKCRKDFEAHGYKMPVLVWWNVNARQDTFHANAADSDTRFVSGASAAVFKGLCEHLGSTPTELMLSVLNDERYACIQA